MTALILFAHGSWRPETKPVFEGVVTLMHEKTPLTRLDAPSQIRLAQLGLDELSLSTVCAELAAADKTQTLVVPLLFIDAFRSRVDVPEQVRLCDRRGIDITAAEGLGSGDGTKRTVVRRIVKAVENASFSWLVNALVTGVGLSDEGASAAVHQFVVSLGGMLPRHVSTAFAVGPERIKGANAVVAAQKCAAKRGHRLVVVSLLTAPGLLWDRVIDVGTAAGANQVASGEPLAELLVLVVYCRWNSRAVYVGVQVVAQPVFFPPQLLAVTGPWSG